MKHLIATVASLVGYVSALSMAVYGQQGVADGPRYTNANALIRPTNYRQWTFLSSGVGMTYAASGGAAAASPSFGNVFVNPASYQAFLQTGRWPDRTIFVLETRGSATEGSIVKGGRFQTQLAGLEAEVKDSRFPGGWAFFNFGAPARMKDAEMPLSGDAVASCVECHTDNTAVERTFVQFYPTLLEVARAKGTLKPGF